MYEMRDMKNGKVYTFSGLEEMLKEARRYVLGYLGVPDIRLYGPAGEVGRIEPNDLSYAEGREFVITWRLPLEPPRPYCMECGADDRYIIRGRCTRCGCDDMISYRYYVQKKEILSRW